jgi:hypothetical protein
MGYFENRARTETLNSKRVYNHSSLKEIVYRDWHWYSKSESESS